MKLIVYGASDDLVEVEGDIREEFNGDKGYLIFSDGTVLTVEYEYSVWRFERVHEGELSFTKHPNVPEDDGPRRKGGEFDTLSAYSEIVVLEGDVEITSVMFGERWERWESRKTDQSAPTPAVTPWTPKAMSMRDEIAEALAERALYDSVEPLLENGVLKVLVIDRDADMFRITVEQI